MVCASRVGWVFMSRITTPRRSGRAKDYCTGAAAARAPFAAFACSAGGRHRYHVAFGNVDLPAMPTRRDRPPHPGADHRRRTRRLHCRDSTPRARRWRRRWWQGRAAGRATDDHHRRRELSGGDHGERRRKQIEQRIRENKKETAQPPEEGQHSNQCSNSGEEMKIQNAQYRPKGGKRQCHYEIELPTRIGRLRMMQKRFDPIGMHGDALHHAGVRGGGKRRAMPIIQRDVGTDQDNLVLECLCRKEARDPGMELKKCRSLTGWRFRPHDRHRNRRRFYTTIRCQNALKPGDVVPLSILRTRIDGSDGAVLVLRKICIARRDRGTNCRKYFN